ncbi:uncharacterized protein VP01_852g3 [Puccinia sorghi]|uniref:Uncharacterized protein n=1 Tax=Puccinia sorghi TaxID=27349 RepID=A0A0L6U932_9BASI|nr:uncharacterized protein VP01_852g3 [Puccinia sorghi]
MPFLGGMPFSYPPMNAYPGLPYAPSPMPFAARHHPVPHHPPITLMGTNPNAQILSPAPSNNHIKLDEYFCFTHVGPEFRGISTALAEHGITHYTQFQNVQAAKLEEAGMKRAHAIQGVSTALAEHGITHYTQFQNVQAAELEEAGMKRAHAWALVNSYKQFEHHLKSLHSKQAVTT